MSIHNEISKLISKTQEDYNKENGVECIEQLFKLLKLSKSEEINKICLKLIKNQGAWKCKDCQKNKESIYCNECWGLVRKEHINENHKYEYIGDYICGTCDCGNSNNIDEKFICPKHKKNYEENISIDEEKKKKFQIYHKELFSQMANYISEQIFKNDTNNELFMKNVVSFIDYISQLSFNSKNLLNWISELLLKNYPITNIDNNHKCIDLTDILTPLKYFSQTSNNRSRTSSESNMINMIYPIINKCSCPFLRYLISVWPNKKINTLLSFSQNYDLKISIGILYLFLYDKLMLIEKNDFSYLSKEFLFSEIRLILSKEEHKYLLNNILESPVLIINNYIKPLFNQNENININKDIEKLYSSAKKVVNNLKFDILNILSNNTQINFISDDAQFYLYLIDMLAEFHNINSIKGKFNHTQKETNDSYNSVLLQIELSLLDIFTTMTSIIDFKNFNTLKKIFSYFNEKIWEKKFKILSKDEYSYHISLFRGFSIFLNRFCFFFASKNNCDIIEGCKYIKENNLMKNYEECFEYLFGEMSKLFRFIAACGEDLFIQCGENMTLYEKTYYYTYKFVYRDFSLMKYLIPHGSFKEFFSISDDKEDLKAFLYFNDKKSKNIESLLEKDENRKYLKFLSRLLTIILNIIRNNGSLIWNLGSSYKALKSCQIKDELLENVINADIVNMKELAKTLIINKAIVEENSASYSDLYNGIYYILREIMTEEEVENLVHIMFDSTVKKDQKVNYSLKDDYLKIIDTNYILSPKWKAKAEKYLYDFKKNQISIFNRYFYNVNKFEAILTEEIYKKIYTINNEQNLGSIEFIIDSIKKLVKENDYNELRPFFLNTLLNYFDVFLCVDFPYFKKMRNYLREKIDTFIEEIFINNLEEPYKSYCDLIIKNVKGNNMEIENEEKVEKNKSNDIKKNLIEKHKLKRKKFLDEIKNNEQEIKKLLTENNPNINNKGLCSYCKNNINEKDLGNCYGKLGYFLLDKFNYNSSLRKLRKLYDKYIKKEGNITSFKNILNNIDNSPKENSKRNLRIFDCKHLIHFSCFFENFMKSGKTSINNFVCPGCKKNANTFIPKINHILNDKDIDKDIYEIFKGYNLDFIMKFRSLYGDKIKKFFDNDKSNINLISETEYKKIKKKEKLVNEEKKYIIKNYENIFISCRHLIEGFFSIKNSNHINFDIESDGFNEIQKDSLLYCFLQFRDFIDFFIKCDKKNEQLFLWKNMILSFRLMLKTNILHDNFFANFYLLLYRMHNLNRIKNISNLIIDDQFTNILSGILFLICVFFEYDGIKGYEKYILYLFLPLFSFSYYFRKLYLDNSLTFIKETMPKSKFNKNEKAFIYHMETNKFFDFLKTDNAKNCLIFILKKIIIVNYLLKNKEEVGKDMFDIDNMFDWINLSQLKQKNILEILDELEIMINHEKNLLDNAMIDINEEPKEYIYNIFFNFMNKKNNTIYNHKNIFQFLINEFKKDINKNIFPKNINPNLLCFCEEIDYDFIDLPEYAVDFLFKKYTEPCERCNKRGNNGLFCLDCGKKAVCIQDAKNIKNDKNNTDVYLELFDKHVELCGGGTGAFLNTVDFKVIFFQHKKLADVKIPIYLDKHGEAVKEKSIHNGFRLNKPQLDNAIRHYYNNELILP